jgi:16S rRNA (guanine966-N2)-methyltransferase
MQLISPPAKSNAIRPTSDRCREALFSILNDRLSEARVLDLYAGTGALALEALSRGAQAAVVVDNSTTAHTLLHKNVQRLKRYYPDDKNAGPPVTIIHSDLRKGLSAITRFCNTNFSIFDVIFLDPPYGKGLAQKTLEDLDNGTFLANNGLVVAEERSKVVLSETLTHLQCIDKRKYGDTTFWIYSTL